MSKQYGLILPSKDKKHTIGQVTARPSIFEEDSDSDTPVLQKPTGLTKSRKQDKINQSKAIEQDPTVYQYDEIYGEMDQKRKESKLSQKNLDKKPKYIGRLLQTAERRKRENERRIERQVQKEREAEGEEFKDKESFVTSSYKKKLEEMKALEDAEKREEYLESIGDVRKQGNLDGFYRHLYDQKVNYEDGDAKNDKDIKKETTSDNKANLDLIPSTNSNKVNDESDGSISNNKKEDSEMKQVSNSSRKKRTYRSRKDSEDNSHESDGVVEVKKEHLPSNLDADSDFSIDSSSEDEDKETGSKKETEQSQKEENNKVITKTEEKGNVLSDNAALAKASVADKDEAPEKVEEVNKIVKEEPLPKKPKIDIWKKRTVGEVFDAALKRYFERKAQRESLQG